MPRALDAVDHKIVALLQENARRTYADIGAHVSLSVAAVKRRVDRLERDGIIQGYAAIVDTASLGERIDVLIEVYGAERTAPDDIRKSVQRLDEVLTAYTVSGEPDAVLRVQVESVDHLTRVVEKLRRDPTIVRTKTMLVLSTIVSREARASRLG